MRGNVALPWCRPRAGGRADAAATCAAVRSALMASWGYHQPPPSIGELPALIAAEKTKLRDAMTRYQKKRGANRPPPLLRPLSAAEKAAEKAAARPPPPPRAPPLRAPP